MSMEELKKRLKIEAFGIRKGTRIRIMVEDKVILEKEF